MSLSEWRALRRVQQGGVAKSAGVYLDHGHATPGYLAEVFDQLTWAGLVSVAAGDPLWELRRLHLTEAGHARYTAGPSSTATADDPTTVISS